MKLPTPQEIGLPEKFDRWRPTQEQALHKLLTSTKRVDAMCLSTGSGKSVVAIGYALITKKPTCYVTESRGLQDQLSRDFGEIGLVDLRGRSNYPCDLKPDSTCEEGYASRCPYKGTPACPASKAEMRAAVSSLVVTNYAKWTSARKFGQGMAHFQQLILDEGHSAPRALDNAMQVTLHHKEIEETLGVPFPTSMSADEMVNWKPWAAEARAECEQMMIGARNQMNSVPDPKQSWVRHYLHMRNLSRRLATIATARPADWVVDEVEKGFQFDPIRSGRYAEAALLLRVPRIVVMSATLRPKTMFMIGVAKDKFDFTEIPSDFDAKRCPVFWVPTMRVDKNARDLSPLWMRLDQVAAKRQDRKGLIHTISYARRNDVVGSSRFHNRMLVNAQGDATTEIIEEFRQSPKGTILVSPSIGAGYDFPGSDAEWQLICKIPFPDGRSKILKARQQEDPEYGAYLAMQSFVQMCGRLMRSHKDQGESFIFDDHIEWFLPRYGHLAPRSFHMFFRRVEMVPQPPPALSL